MKWMYGVTTCPDRFNTLLPRTLASLAAAGFDRPRLFVDGLAPGSLKSTYDVTERIPRIKPYANWMLGLVELYARDPNADRWAMFQDDIVTVRNLRSFLERAPYPERAYLNLYTIPANAKLARRNGEWYEGQGGVGGPPELRLQQGKGALALVFNRTAVQTLLSARHNVERVMDVTSGWRGIDGAVVTAMNYAGFREYVMVPSLVQHTGEETTLDKRRTSTFDSPHFSRKRYRPESFADTFPGEHFDATTFKSDG